jgi:hypothetical protein
MDTEILKDGKDTATEFISVKELANKIGMSVKFVQKHCGTGRLVGMRKVGRNVKFDLSMVEKQMLKEDFLLPSPNSVAGGSRRNYIYSRKCIDATKGLKNHGSIT